MMASIVSVLAPWIGKGLESVNLTSVVNALTNLPFDLRKTVLFLSRISEFKSLKYIKKKNYF